MLDDKDRSTYAGFACLTSDEEGAAQVAFSPQYRAQVAGAKIVAGLMPLDHDECSLPLSVTSQALVMPQLCRSAGNPRSLVHMSVRSFLFVFIRFFLQLFLLYMLSQEELVMDKFAGEMYLCDFGANIERCPDGPNCVGPGGTNYENPGRMHSFSAWATRSFVRDSLRTLFADKIDEIDKTFDPGEYGLENYWVRFVCLFIFMMTGMADLRVSMDLVSILRALPTSAEPWMEYKVPTWDTKENVKRHLGKGEIDFVTFKLAGMSLKWKLLNMFLLVLPRFAVLWGILNFGTVYLMETAGIEDVVINVTALAFIFKLDELIFSCFSHRAAHHILSNIEPFSLSDRSAQEDFTPEECLSYLEADKNRPLLHMNLLPVRMLMTLCMALLFGGKYYYTYCERAPHGGIVSKSMFLPVEQVYPIVSFLFPTLFPAHSRPEPYWEMPVFED